MRSVWPELELFSCVSAFMSERMRKLQSVFPIALLTTGHSLMTGLVVILGLTGKLEIAADVALVQGAALAFFFAFSANARSLILSSNSESAALGFLKARLILALPLCVGVIALSVTISGVGLWFAAALVLRRLNEWLSEIALSELERSRKPALVPQFVILDLATWLVVVVTLSVNLPYAMVAIWVWSVVPLLICAVGFSRLFLSRRATSRNQLELLPHLGSSVVVGLTVYVFRLLVVLLVGREVGGELIAAFALGSLAGTAFGSVIGPSLVMHDLRHGPGLVKRVTLFLVAGMLLAAGIAAMSTVIVSGDFALLNKSQAFWRAVAFSLLGGAVMVVAQVFRLNLIQRPGGGSAFGADVTANVMVIATVPFLFYLLGREALGAAYLGTAIGALLVYGASNLNQTMSDHTRRLIHGVLPLLYLMILFPLFLQFESGIFHSRDYIFDSGGAIAKLPVPISVLACFTGLIILGSFEAARFSLSLIFFAFAAMLVSGTFTTFGDNIAQQAKLILTAQFLLPMFAMAFGQMAGRLQSSLDSVARSFLLVLALVVPWQLAASWLAGMTALRPDLGFFSIYQHLQYVPAVIVAAYVFCTFALWNRSTLERGVILALGPVTALYAFASTSLLAGVSVIAGVVLRAATLSADNGRKHAFALIFVIGIALAFYVLIAKPTSHIGEIIVTTESGDVEVANLRARDQIWRYHFDAVTSSVSTFVLGLPRQPDRALYPSAHNYYLDFLYNFGLFGLIPLLTAIAFTFALCARQWKIIAVDPPLLGLLFAVVFIVLVDSSFKVGLRQPYPGMFGFFLWGLLLSRLQPQCIARSFDGAKLDA